MERLHQTEVMERDMRKASSKGKSMTNYDWLNLFGSVIILIFSISYFLTAELGRAFTTLGLSLVLGLPVIFKAIKRKGK